MSTKPPALHQRIRRDIGDRIRSGALRPGDRIANEHELMAHYGCARMTVNKALSALSEEGLIERRRRAGTFVRAQRLDVAVLDIPDIESEIKQRGDAYQFRVLSRSVRKAGDVTEVELAGDGQVLVVKGLHLVAGQPLALEDRLISLSAVPEAAGVDFDRQSPGHWLLEAVPWTRAENQISAELADAATAKLTGWKKGTACLVVTRRTWRADERITVVRQVFDGGAYRLTARFDHS